MNRLESAEQVVRVQEGRIMMVIKVSRLRKKSCDSVRVRGFLCLPSSKLFVLIWQYLLLACKLQLRAEQTPLDLTKKCNVTNPAFYTQVHLFILKSRRILKTFDPTSKKFSRNSLTAPSHSQSSEHVLHL